MDHERDTDELKAELEHQRAEMADTLREIEDRVAPSSVIERGREQATKVVDRGRTEVRRRVDDIRHSGDDPTASTTDKAGAATMRLATTAAGNAKPAAERVRATTVARPWPMLAIAFVLGLLLGRRR